MKTTIIPPAYVTQSEEEYDKGYDPKVFSRLSVFARPYAGKLLIAVLLMFAASAAAVAGPYFVKIAIDDGLTFLGLAEEPHRASYGANAIELGRALLPGRDLEIDNNGAERVCVR